MRSFEAELIMYHLHVLHRKMDLLLARSQGATPRDIQTLTAQLKTANDTLQAAIASQPPQTKGTPNANQPHP